MRTTQGKTCLLLAVLLACVGEASSVLAEGAWGHVFSGIGGHAGNFRNSTRRVLQSSKAPAAPARNHAIGRLVRTSSAAPGTKAAAAVDGDTWGVFELPGTHAATLREASPWVELDLQMPAQIDALEIWAPFRKCAQYLIKLTSDEKVAVRAQVASGKRPPHFCRGGWPSFEPTPGRPLKVQLLDPAGETVIHSMDFNNRSAVYSWNNIGRQAQVIRVLVPAGAKVSLHVAEIKVYGPAGSGICTRGSCGAGQCERNGLCSCPPNMVGPQCEYNIMGAEHFMPHQPHHGWWNSHDVAEYHGQMAHLQSHCKQKSAMRKHMILPGPGGMGAGLGSTMYFRTGVMTEAFNRKQGYLYYGRFNYALNKYCQSQGELGTFECYFEPMIPCPKITQQLRSSHTFPSASQKGPRGEDCLVPDSHGKVSAGCGTAGPGFKSVPHAFSKRGLFWWRMMQIGYLMRPNQKTLELLNLGDLKQRIGYSHPIIGLHMRSGDGCRYGLRSRMFNCRTLADYLPEIRALSQKYGVRRVFVSTDDVKAIRDAKAMSNEFEWVVVDSDRSQFKSDVKIEHRLTGIAGAKMDSHATMVSTLQDLFLLAEADYLVTHQASTMSRIALQLSTLFHRRLTPFFSMDGPWCPHWRMCCDPDHIQGTSKEC
eukprot:jgi/Tetstr1/441500/TSEL_029731.t1